MHYLLITSLKYFRYWACVDKIPEVYYCPTGPSDSMVMDAAYNITGYSVLRPDICEGEDLSHYLMTKFRLVQIEKNFRQYFKVHLK